MFTELDPLVAQPLTEPENASSWLRISTALKPLVSNHAVDETHGSVSQACERAN